jgi:hypothetical protein
LERANQDVLKGDPETGQEWGTQRSVLAEFLYRLSGVLIEAIDCDLFPVWIDYP